MDTAPDRAALHAVPPVQRLELLDVLRGFAILGILFVNVHFYSRPIYTVFRDLEPSSSAVDRAVVAATDVLVTEKFFSILSVLFGIGTAILVDLVAFGRPFIANPDLPDRLRRRLPLASFEAGSLFGGGATGCTDCPAWGSHPSRKRSY